MKVLLLYPGGSDTVWSFKHVLKFIRQRAALPPPGLRTTAAMLPEAWEKRLVDVNVRPLHDKDLARADEVLISATTAHRDSSAELIARRRLDDRNGRPIVDRRAHAVSRRRPFRVERSRGDGGSIPACGARTAPAC